MRKWLIIGCLVMVSCAKPPVKSQLNSAEISVRQDYTIQLKERSDDLFKVTLRVRSLSPANNIFNFAALGSYEGVNFRNYLRTFRTFDSHGHEIPARQISSHQWLISQPERVAVIYYEIRDTWNAPAEPTPIVEMAGSSIEEDYVYINGQGVLGFIRGMENLPIRIRLECPAEWRIGTALQMDENGRLLARNFGEAASAPILLGNLSFVSERIIGSEVFIYTYSKTGLITADDLVEPVQAILTATYDFLGGKLPLEKDYTMLFIFEDKQVGGIEYRNSSAFVFREDDFGRIKQETQDVIAHEYFHLVIPFSIRSDALDHRQSLNPNPTANLWFFEGVTEWASDMLQVRSELKSMRDYFLRDFRAKLFQEDFHGSETSLRDISLAAPRHPHDYLNVYSRGALAAALLDIHLLDLSYGRRGLREVINDLILDYGKERPLPEEQFINILQDYCGPDFKPFFQRYISGNEKLPVEEFLAKIGIIYTEEKVVDAHTSDPGIVLGNSPGGITVLWVDDALSDRGVQKGDIVLKFNDTPLTEGTYHTVLEGEISRMAVGEVYTLHILRNNRPTEITCQTVPLKARHLFSLPPALSPAQLKIRQAWLTNL